MAGALRAMGVGIEETVSSSSSGAGGSGEAWRVLPTGLHGPATVDVGNAGTVMRFLPPVAALADGPAYGLAGGISAWKRAGFPTSRG